MKEKLKVIVATKHGKEKLFKQVLAPQFNFDLFTQPDFDTDNYGSFSGKIPRNLSAKETLKQKCLVAMYTYGFKLGLASEGSFGNHPLYHFGKFNEEWVVFIDLENNLEIYGVNRTSELNWGQILVNNWEELDLSLKNMDFPNHKIIVKLNNNEGKIISENATDFEQLKTDLEKYNNLFPFFLETDLRAMHNPTRQISIVKAIENLKQNLLLCCPKCNIPGFVVTKTQSGLPCNSCGLPTKSNAFTYKVCAKCNYELKQAVDKRFEDPQFCDFCNP